MCEPVGSLPTLWHSAAFEVGPWHIPEVADVGAVNFFGDEHVVGIGSGFNGSLLVLQNSPLPVHGVGVLHQTQSSPLTEPSFLTEKSQTYCPASGPGVMTQL